MVIVKSGEERSETEKLMDEIEVLKAENENLKLKNRELMETIHTIMRNVYD